PQRQRPCQSDFSIALAGQGGGGKGSMMAYALSASCLTMMSDASAWKRQQNPATPSTTASLRGCPHGTRQSRLSRCPANTGGRKYCRPLPPRVRKCYDSADRVSETSYGQQGTAQQSREAQTEEREAKARTAHFDLLRHDHQELGWQEEWRLRCGCNNVDLAD